MKNELEFPSNYVERYLQMKKLGNNITTIKKGRSSYEEYTEENLWNDEILEDICDISKIIIDYVKNDEILKDKSYYGKKIVSIDIETTDFIPKAREGFVNILGLTSLNLRNSSEGNIELFIYQAFNMLRKKDDAPHLLNLSWNFINDADILIVFNKSFDINILQTIIDKYNLNYKFPKNIIDMRDYFKNLVALEDYLKEQVGFERIHSKKGKYKEYYQLFKGQGKRGMNKKIDPIGIYNLMDTLTPLFGFCMLSQ